MSDSKLPSGVETIERYRQSMDVDVLRSWAADAQVQLDTIPELQDALYAAMTGL